MAIGGYESSVPNAAVPVLQVSVLCAGWHLLNKYFEPFRSFVLTLVTYPEVQICTSLVKLVLKENGYEFLRKLSVILWEKRYTEHL